jgi:long-chain acyl-CoA synthetase
MKGYLDKPEATAEAMRNGWFHSGDLARIDADGYVYIVDRKKDMILKSGYNVYPREVEEVLYRHPAVAEAAVVGVPDAAKGEEVKAFVVLREGASAAEDELIDHCRELIAPYKCPRYVELTAALPKSATGKILRRELRDQAREQSQGV